MKRILKLLVIGSIGVTAFAKPPPDLPGIEVTDSEIVLEQSQRLVEKKSPEFIDIYRNKGWTAPSLEEQLNQEGTFIGMGQGAIFVPRFTETRLEPEYAVLRIDSLPKEHAGREWIGKTGVRLVVPYGNYRIAMGSGSRDKHFEYEVQVEEGKTTLIPPDWGGLVINTINEDGEFISESYEIFSIQSGESYGKGFGLTQERISDIKTWILQPQVYRISRSGENASSILNYITVQVNPGELTHVELVFEESTGRLVAGGVHKMRINTAKNSYWSYGLRLGGSASYITFISADGQRDNSWNAIGDLRLRALYSRTKTFWLTELYIRENMQLLNERQKEENQWNIIQDLLQFQSSVVYRIRDWIGPYVRANVKTHIFSEYHLINNSDSNIYRVNENGDTLEVIGDRIRIGPPFDPIRIGEGIGLNLSPKITNTIDVSAQTGFAARQTIRNKMLIPVNKTQTVFAPATSNIYDYGWENSLNMRFSFRFLTLDLIGEIFFPKFFPKAKINDYVIEELSADLRVALTRYLELSWMQQLIDRIAAGMEEAEGMSRFESLNTVQLRFYVNF
ncbi:MAG: hypothetical protein LBC85_06400 [Fibromonadaceae bacterium]|jgi:hypothetical protein|nr:hypothetical protein [Fibromonadaceae bacterium]